MHVNVIVDSFVFLLPQSLLAKLCSSFFWHSSDCECLLYRLLEGYWSENGCETVNQYEDSRYKYVECRCRHLSTFAVLMDLSDDVR